MMSREGELLDRIKGQEEILTDQAAEIKRLNTECAAFQQMGMIVTRATTNAWVHRKISDKEHEHIASTLARIDRHDAPGKLLAVVEAAQAWEKDRDPERLNLIVVAVHTLG